MEDVKKSGIYQITYRGKIYVGSAKCFKERWRIHLRDLRIAKHHSSHLQRAFSKYGEAGIAFSILEFVPDLSQLVAREQFYLDTLQPFGDSGYNASPTAGSCIGVKRSDDYRRRSSESRKGKRLPAEAYARGAAARRGLKVSDELKARRQASFAATIAARVGFVSKNKGRPLSPEHIAKMAANASAQKRHAHRPETIERIRAANTGRKRTPETIARMSAAMLGTKRGPMPQEVKDKIRAANTGKVFSPEWCARISAGKKGKPRGLRKAA